MSEIAAVSSWRPDSVAAHPTPMLSRDGWHDLCGRWGFAYDDADVGLTDGWFGAASVFDREIIVPFPPESPASGIGDPGYHPIVWYRIELDAPSPAADMRRIMHLGAVDYATDVWVAGSHVHHHQGGQTPIAVDITDRLNRAGATPVVIRVVDDPLDLHQPRGKQDWRERPAAIHYERTTGIWQPVWTEDVPALHISGLTWRPAGLDAVQATVRWAGRSTADPVHLRIELRFAGEVVATASAAVDGDAWTGRLEPRLPDGTTTPPWAPDSPSLLDAVVSLGTDRPDDNDDPSAVDRVHSYTALRTVEVRDGSFWLNGERLPLRMALSQGYWPASHLAAPDGTAIEAEVGWVRRFGFNAIRVHQKTEDPRFLSTCDRAGVAVIADCAAAFAYSPEAVEATQQQWTEVLRRDAGHPCILGWIAFNESWGVDGLADEEDQRRAVTDTVSLIRTLDPTRPVIGNDGWEWIDGDAVGIHDYTHRPGQLRRRYRDRVALSRTLHRFRPSGRVMLLAEPAPGAPVLLSEFGGFTIDARGDAWSGYGAKVDADGLLRGLADLLGPVHESIRGRALAGFCWTQLADTAQERNGLLDEERRPKADPDLIAAIVHPH